MTTFSKVPVFIAASAVVFATVGAMPGSQRLLYQANATSTQGQQQSVTAIVTIAPASGGARVTISATGAPAVTVTIPSGGAMPAPEGTPSAQRAQGTLILRRIALLATIRRAMPTKSLNAAIPVLPPGASEPLALPSQLTQSGGATALTGSASTSAMATIDPAKAKIKGILPARRVAERVKNALTPAHVTLPDEIAATVRAPVANGSVAKLSGQVVHVLTAHGQTTTVTENWSLKPSR